MSFLLFKNQTVSKRAQHPPKTPSQHHRRTEEKLDEVATRLTSSIVDTGLSKLPLREKT